MIYLSAHLQKGIREHAVEVYPLECCGALVGRRAGDDCRVHRILRLDNNRETQDARRRYLVSPRDVMNAEKIALNLHMDLVGFYHSHPDHPARPSSYDLEHALPWYLYVIVSVEAGVAGPLACWTLRDDRQDFVTEPLQAVGPPPSPMR